MAQLRGMWNLLLFLMHSNSIKTVEVKVTWHHLELKPDGTGVTQKMLHVLGFQRVFQPLPYHSVLPEEIQWRGQK